MNDNNNTNPNNKTPLTAEETVTALREAFVLLDEISSGNRPIVINPPMIRKLAVDNVRRARNYLDLALSVLSNKL